MYELECRNAEEIQKKCGRNAEEMQKKCTRKPQS
jgi:hypothetical protein